MFSANLEHVSDHCLPHLYLKLPVTLILVVRVTDMKKHVLKIATRHGHHEANGWFAVLALLMIVLAILLAGVLIVAIKTWA